jgi:hypothetical protein
MYTEKAENGSTINYRLHRASTYTGGSMSLFTVTNATAFILYGDLNWDHLGVFVTVEPLIPSIPVPSSNQSSSVEWEPDPNDPARMRSANDSSSYYEMQNILYFESGLDRDKAYDVTVLKPDMKLGNHQSAFGLRYMDIFDAKPNR